jgi:hypothetical protein
MPSITRKWPGLIVIALLTATLLGSANVQALQDRPAPGPILITDPVPDPHELGVTWFAETGHTLRGVFLEYWTEYGGLPQFGYPISEEFIEPAGEEGKEPMRVQYFERNRFEHHPEFAGTPYEVLLGSLGLDFHTSDPPAAVGRAPDNMHFGETGHNLWGPFRAYWEAHGSLFVHGYPITEPYYEKANPTDGKSYLVQYFERSRFEWHPEYGNTPYEVLLGLLGAQLAQKKGYFYGWYPKYGHAADYSWIAGEPIATLHDPPADFRGGCTVVCYEDPALGGDKCVQLSSVTGNENDLQRPVNTPGMVVFGHMARPDEQYRACPPDPWPVYIVDTIQPNPVQ